MIENNLLEPGDYVLATKYQDGDPSDQWVVGFFVGMLPKVTGDRYEVADEQGNLYRNNGFRRAKKINSDRGRWLLEHQKEIESGCYSVWWWVNAEIKNA